MMIYNIYLKCSDNLKNKVPTAYSIDIDIDI